MSRTISPLALGACAALAVLVGALTLLIGRRRRAQLADAHHALDEQAETLAALQAERDALLQQLDHAGADQVLRMDEAVAAEDLRRAVQAAASALEGLSAGDFGSPMRMGPDPDAAGLAARFNAARQALAGALAAINGSAEAIGLGVARITNTANRMSHGADQQAANLAQTAASLTELTASVRYSAEGAVQVEETVQRACRDAADSDQLVDEAVAAMGEIQRSSSEIDQIVGLIEEISFQTNLLALNAGVEAARAGEAGRGFAVVATEVRALAQRSSSAAKDIKALIHASGEHVQRGVGLVDRTGQALRHIAIQVSEIACTISEIAGSAREQAVSLAEVNTAVNKIGQFTQHNAALVEETTAATYDLGRRSDELAVLLHRFELPEATSQAALLDDAA